MHRGEIIDVNFGKIEILSHRELFLLFGLCDTLDRFELILAWLQLDILRCISGCTEIGEIILLL